nr:hypothetical protein [uncultured Flavobacterium sp.]
MKKKNRKEVISKVFGKVFVMMALAMTFSCQDTTLEEEKTTTTVVEKKQNFNKISASASSDLARRWAPIHYKDVDATGTYSEGGKSDYLTAINYDNDWNAENNWNNLPAFANSLSAHCYYSVVESKTHWFITYAFFSPRDWTDIALLYQLDQHENDLEGVLMIVEKDGSAYGSLKGAVTTNHSDFFSYATAGSSFVTGLESIDGTLQMKDFNGEMHPVTAQEAKGHGLKAWPQHDINGDGIIYYPSASRVAQIPADNYDNYVEYKLVDIFEAGGLWDQRFNTDLFFNAGGGFKGNDFKSGGANAPWAWNDGNDGIVQGGELATDPAKLADNYFDGVGNFSRTYINNNYNAAAGGVVTVFQNCNYTGYAVALPVGNYTLAQLKSYGVVNDDLSSVRLESGYKITLYQNDNFGGETIIITGNNSCLGTFNDKASSVKISVL